MTENTEKPQKRLSKIAGIKKLIIGIFCGVFLLVCLWLILRLFSTAVTYFPSLGGDRIASGITKEKILSLKIGMNKDTVINVLGTPIETEPRGTIDASGNWHSLGVDLTYATPGLLGTGLFGVFGVGFKIYIGLIDNKLSFVHIKRGDTDIYYCDKDRCPGVINSKDFEKLLLLSSQ